MRDIRFEVSGAAPAEVSEGLELSTAEGSILDTGLAAFQEDGALVPCSFFVSGQTYGFEVDTYDHAQDLVIDPLLVSTFVGAPAYDVVEDLAFDARLNVNRIIGYGVTCSPTFTSATGTSPTWGADSSYGGGWDVFVFSLSSTLGSPNFITYLGGSGNDSAFDTMLDRQMGGVAVDGSGNIYVTGVAGSWDFPTTVGAYDTTIGGGIDGFVTKLDSSGNLVYSTFFGGSNGDYPLDIAVDDLGRAFVVGYTYSSPTQGFPATPSSQVKNGYSDAFLTVFSAAGDAVDYSKLIGGDGVGEEELTTVAVHNGNAYVAGWTASDTNIISSANPYDSTFNGATDGFFMIIQPTVTVGNVLYTTYLGGPSTDVIADIAVSSTGMVYFCGFTGSTGIATTGAYDPVYNGNFDGFVAKLNPAGGGVSDRQFLTYLGGSEYDALLSVYLGGSEEIHVVGCTDSTDYPTNQWGYDQTANGLRDAVYSKLTSEGTLLQISQYFGGSGNDEARAVIVNQNGGPVLAGLTESSNFPVTSGTWSDEFDGSAMGFVTVFSLSMTISASTFVGYESSEALRSVKVDSDGYIYIAASTRSPDYPWKTGSYDIFHNGGYDVSVTKLSPDGSTVVYSTFIGGVKDDIVAGIEIDGDGRVYVAGYTESPDFPTTIGAYDTVIDGAGNYNDGFVLRLNAEGSALEYSTFFGGANHDYPTGIAVDSTGAAYICGDTLSATGFPTASGTFQTAHQGGYDSFAVKISNDGTALSYGTILGSAGTEHAYSIAVDSEGCAAIMGRTDSADFPTVGATSDTTFNGGTTDAFYVRLHSSGAALTSTFLGGSGNEIDYVSGLSSRAAVAIDSSRNAYVAYNTKSSDIATSVSAYDRTFNGGTDVVVAKIAIDGSIVYTSYLGGTGGEAPTAISLDSSNNVYVLGDTASSNFPTTRGAYDTSFNGGQDMFVARLGTSLQSLHYSTFLGGIGADAGWGMAVDAQSDVYVVGSTSSSNFPMTDSVLDEDFGDGTDGVLSKLDLTGPPSSPQSLTAVAAVNEVQLSWTAPAFDGNSAVTGYLIYRGTSPGSGTCIDSSATTSYVDQSVVSGTTYYYWVTAENALGEGSPSNEVSATAFGSPSAPINVVATGGVGSVTITWDPPTSDGGSAILGYRVHYGTAPDVYDQTPIMVDLADGEECVVGGLGTGMTFYFAVVAYNVHGFSPFSSEVSAATGTVPSAPVLNSVTPLDGQALVSWTLSSDPGSSAITDYCVYAGLTADDMTCVATVGPTTTMTICTGLTNGVTYYFRVAAVSSVGQSPLSNAISAVPYGPPDAPGNFMATSGLDCVVLSWDTPYDGGKAITRYYIYKGTSVDNLVQLPYIGPANTWTDTNVDPGVTYYYKVLAYNGAWGDLTGAASACPYVAPDAPVLVSATVGADSIALVWTVPDDNGASISQYKVMRRTASTSFSVLATIAPGTSYTDSTAVPGTTYYYGVIAVNSGGDSPMSNVISAIIAGPPGVPTGFTAVGQLGGVQLSWTAPTEDGGSPILGYWIYRGPSEAEINFYAWVDDGTSYFDDGGINGTTYYYVVMAANAVSVSPYSEVRTAMPYGPPSQPWQLTITSGEDYLTLVWTTPQYTGGSPITGYTVYRGSSAGTLTLYRTQGASTTFIETNVTDGVTWYYAVTASNIHGESTMSPVRWSKTFDVPDAPTNLVATRGNTEAFLNWNAPLWNGGDAVICYHIYRNGVEIDTTTETDYHDTGLTNGVQYTYFVTAENQRGQSDASTSSAVTPATTPGTVTPLDATNAGSGRIDLDWDAPADGGSAVLYYLVYRGTGGAKTVVANITVTYFQDTGLINGQAYYYEVRAANDVGLGNVGAEASATPVGPPSPVTVSAMGYQNYILVEWTPPADDGGAPVTEYRIYIGDTPDNVPYALTVNALTLSYQHTGLLDGVTRYYYVLAYNDHEVSESSNLVTATTWNIPSSPTELEAVIGDGQVHLSWSAPLFDWGAEVTGYAVYVNGIPQAWTNSETLSATITGLTNGQSYLFEVTAENAVGEGPAASVSATPATVPSAPTELGAQRGNGEATLSWTAPADGGSAILYYVIYRDGAQVATSTEVSYTDSGLTNGVQYTYRVSAVNARGESALSSSAFVTPATVPSAPLNIHTVPGATSIVLSWDAPSSDGGSSVLHYYIYSGLSSGIYDGGDNAGLSTEMSFEGLTPGVVYYFVVVAVNDVGESTYSVEVSAAAGTPTAPQGFGSSPGDGLVTLSWSAPSFGGDVTYHLFRDNVLIWSGSGTSYSDLAVIKGVNHTYNVVSENIAGWGENTTSVVACSLGTPYAPSGLSVVAGQANAQLSWSAPAWSGLSVNGYLVYLSTIPGTYGEGQAVVGTSFTWTGLEPATTYYWMVCAVNALGEGDATSEEQFTTLAVPPGPPQTLSADASVGAVTLTWSAPSYDGGAAITGYRIYIGTATGSYESSVTVGAVTSYQWTGLPNSSTYYFVVSAINAAGEGEVSGEASAIMPTVPGEPRYFSVYREVGKAFLSWTAPASDGGAPITGYRVYYGTSADTIDTMVEVGLVTEYVLSGLANDQTYFYEVTAITEVGEGARSDSRWTNPIYLPTEPRNLAAEMLDGTIHLTWDEPLDGGNVALINYTIYRDGAFLVNVTSGENEYSDLTAVVGTVHTYEVTVWNELGESPASNEVTFTRIAVASPPTDFTATPSNGAVVLSWSAPANIGGSAVTGYLVFMRTSPTGAWGLAPTVAGTQYTWSGLTNGVTYYFAVAAVNGAGDGEMAYASAVPRTVPGAPTSFQAVAGDGTVTLSWVAPSSNGGSAVTSYRVYRGTSSGVFTDSVLIGAVTTYQWTGLVNGQEYYFAVEAVNAAGSSTKSYADAMPCTVPDAPTGLVAVAGEGSVALNWTAPSDNGAAITAYKVYWGTSASSLSHVLQVSTISATVTGLTGGTTYYFAVVAVNSEGEGARSQTASATPPAPPTTVPGAPQDLEVVVSEGKAVLSWSAPADDGGASITSYKVFRGTSTVDLVLLTTVTGTTYTDTSVLADQTYIYEVVAVNEVGDSTASEDVSVTVPAPAKPSSGGLDPMLLAIIAVVAIIGVLGAAMVMRRKKA